MKVRTGVTVYKCEHCGKTMFRKHAMEHHEKWCFKNPDNSQVCYGCKYLEETQVTIYWDGYDGEHEGRAKGFKCAKLGKLLYPLSVQRRGLDGRFPEHFEDQQPMPKECEHHDNGFNF